MTLMNGFSLPEQVVLLLIGEAICVGCGSIGGHRLPGAR